MTIQVNVVRILVTLLYLAVVFFTPLRKSSGRLNWVFFLLVPACAVLGRAIINKWGH